MSSQISKSSNDKSWYLLQTEINKCFKCRLHTQGIFPIFGDGSIKAKVVFIGEAPGLMENRLKKPFVGRSGLILNDYLSKINLSRNTVFITNVIKCRPPKNRDPMLDEITACTPYLSRQINLLNAEIIVTLGRFATQFFFNAFTSMTKIVGKIIHLDEIYRLLPMYHPATCLYHPQKYHPLFDRDFRTLKEFLIRKKLVKRDKEPVREGKKESFSLDRFL